VQELADYVADEDPAGAVRWLAPLLARAQTRTARIRLRGAARLLFSGYEHQAAAWVEQVRRLCALANALAGGDVNAMLGARRGARAWRRGARRAVGGADPADAPDTADAVFPSAGCRSPGKRDGRSGAVPPVLPACFPWPGADEAVGPSPDE
jgi:hypothetical protein